METVLVERRRDITQITFNRVKSKNSINRKFLEELTEVFKECENDSSCKVIVLKGQEGYFCTGMDFEEATENDKEIVESNSRPYMEFLKYIRRIPKVVISVVDGRVLAGGVGIVAASDLVISTPKSEFGLSEAIWGLMPSMVLPFLIRRSGVQFAYTMTLTTLNMDALTACKNHLVDIIAEDPQVALTKYCLRLRRIESKTVGRIKEYFKNIWIITEQMENNAVVTTDSLTNDPEIMRNIYNYQCFGKFPWE